MDRHPGAEAPWHHLPDGRYRNPPGSPERTATAWDMVRFLLHQLLAVDEPQVPAGHALERERVLADVAQPPNPGLTWLGHAAFILRLGERTVLTDPFLGERAGPKGFGPRRFVPAPLRPGELPRADVLLVSHNHYDHLDEPTIEAYPYRRDTLVIVPLGLGPFFTRRGYRHVIEHDWWDSWSDGMLTITTLPAVHFSGRGLRDRNRALWASFAIASENERVWFSGDTAPGEIFTEIGARTGPFDLALVGIGAYEPRKIMRSSHATPEEAVAIARAVRARQAIGMHWGTIRLTPEPPFEAPQRFRRAAREQGYGDGNAIVMKVGETRASGR